MVVAQMGKGLKNENSAASLPARRRPLRRKEENRTEKDNFLRGGKRAKNNEKKGGREITMKSKH